MKSYRRQKPSERIKDRKVGHGEWSPPNESNSVLGGPALHPVLVTDKLQKPFHLHESETKQSSADPAHGGVRFPQEML